MPRLVIIIDTDSADEFYSELNCCKSVKRYDYVDSIDPDVMIVGVTDLPQQGG